MLIMVVSQERWMSLDKVRRNLTAFSSWKIKICANFLQTKKRKNFIFIWEGVPTKNPSLIKAKNPQIKESSHCTEKSQSRGPRICGPGRVSKKNLSNLNQCSYRPYYWRPFFSSGRFEVVQPKHSKRPFRCS